MRKYIDAELKVVRLNNDIITSSVGVDATSNNVGNSRVGGRRDMFDDSYDEF